MPVTSGPVGSSRQPRQPRQQRPTRKSEPRPKYDDSRAAPPKQQPSQPRQTYNFQSQTGPSANQMYEQARREAGAAALQASSAASEPVQIPRISAADAIAAAREQRYRDALSYRYGLAGLPQPVQLGSDLPVSDRLQSTGVPGVQYSLQPGTGLLDPVAAGYAMKAWEQLMGKSEYPTGGNPSQPGLSTEQEGFKPSTDEEGRRKVNRGRDAVSAVNTNPKYRATY